MKSRLIAAPLLAFMLLGGCMGSAEEVLPLSRDIVGASTISAVQVVSQAEASTHVVEPLGKPLGERLVQPSASNARAKTLENAIMAAGQQWGLNSGRKLRLVVEIDAYDVTGVAAAALGREDRLAGTVFVRDAQSGQQVGQLYIDVNKGGAGPIRLLARGGNVSDALASEFAERVARSLSGRSRALTPGER